MAAAILQPFVSEANHWMIKHHAIFQGYNFFLSQIVPTFTVRQQCRQEERRSENISSLKMIITQVIFVDSSQLLGSGPTKYRPYFMILFEVHKLHKKLREDPDFDNIVE